MDGVPINVISISELIERISGHRFDGYGPDQIADEIDRFRAGTGTGAISEAVDALKTVATSLTDTEDALRDQLGKLGVAWHSAAGVGAGAIVADESAFSSKAADVVDTSAEALFAQAEGFNRTLHKLPDAQLIRQGSGGLDFGDSVLSLVGFETDHARKVTESREASEQAVEALNGYAIGSGQNLSSVREIVRPDTPEASVSTPVPGSVDAGGAPQAPAPVNAEPAPTRSASAVPIQAPVTAPAPAPAPSPAPAPAPAGYQPPPAAGVPAPIGTPPARGARPPASTAPSSAGPVAPPSNPPAGYPGGGRVPRPGEQRSRTPGSGPTGNPATPGRGPTGSPIPGTGRGSGQVPIPRGPIQLGQELGRLNVAAPGTTAPPAGGGATGKPFVPASPPSGGGTVSETPLARGKFSGAAIQPPGNSGYSGTTYSPAVRAGYSATDLGAGAAAVGAGGAAGAMSGEQERQGRGVGRSAPHAGTSFRQLPLDDLPEEDARSLRNSEKVSPRPGRDPGGLLHRAAPQDGEEDAEHVRSYGVDDSDLFADHRLVSPERIEVDPTVKAQENASRHSAEVTEVTEVTEGTEGVEYTAVEPEN